MPPRNTSRRAGNQRDRNGKASDRQIERLEAETAVPIGQVVGDAERAAQAAFEGVESDATIEFNGETFRLARKVSYLPLLKFAHYASKGTDSASMQGMAAMYEMLRSCFNRGRPCGECDTCKGTEDVPANPRECMTRIGDEWARFEEFAIEIGADDEDLFTVVTRVIEVASARPTRRRSGSQRPAPPISPRSKGNLPPEADGLVTIEDLAR